MIHGRDNNKLVDGVPNGMMGPAWAPSSEECWNEVKRCGCDGLPSLEISLESMELHADTTQHTVEPYRGPLIERT